MIHFLLQTPFLLMALLAGFAASITSGIIGSYVVAKRIVFISGSVAHCVLGGIGLSLWLRGKFSGLEWLDPLYGALFVAVSSAFVMGWIHLKFRQREDTIIAAIWATGMSIGVIFISLTPTYSAELLNFLFGNILWVSRQDLIILSILALVVIGTAALLHKQFLALCFDEEEALLQKVPVPLLYFLLLSLVAISVVLLIEVVGAILVIALLAIPAAIAELFTLRLSKMIVVAILLSCLITFTGTLAAYHLNWPPGATIAITAALLYLMSLLYNQLKT